MRDDSRSKRPSPASWLPQLSLDRRIGVLMLIVTLAVLGIVALRAIPLELIPSGFSQPCRSSAACTRT